MSANKEENTVSKVDVNSTICSSIDILRQENLLQLIVDEVHKEFYGGDEEIKTVIISITTRLVKNAEPTSKNLVISEKSGAGKDKLVSTVSRILLEPEVTYFHRSKLSPEVFTYWNADNEEWSWNGKLIHIEDPPSDILNCTGFKTMASGDKHATVVKEQKAVTTDIKGKPNMIITTYTGVIDDEGARRWPFVHLDSSVELTRLVKRKIAQRYAHNDKMKEDSELNRAFRELKSYMVIIPFAEELVDKFPCDDVIARTYFKRHLDYICASAVLHQYQRELNKDGYLVATRQDEEVGKKAFQTTVTNHAMIPLSRDQEELLKILKDKKDYMFVSEIHSKIGKSRTWIYRNLEFLKKNHLVSQVSEWKLDANKEVAKYKYRLW